VQTAHFSAYFNSLHASYQSLLELEDAEMAAYHYADQNTFTNVCRYLMYARVHTVYSGVSGRRAENRVAVPRATLVPKAVGDVINSVGRYVVPSFGHAVTPQPETMPQDQARRLTTLVGFDALDNFTALVNAVERRNAIRTVPIESHIPGTAFWLLKACEIANPANVADGNQADVLIRSSFMEWTPADAFLAAITQHQSTGILNTCELNWQSDPIHNVPSLRGQYSLDA
jgi:hypothetical protein